jgi:6-phosphogluconolactonase
VYVPAAGATMSLRMIVDKPEGIPRTLVREVADEARQALRDRGTFAIALPGGSVATSCFPALAAASVDWSRTDFFWGDERAVPPDHPESNYGLARRLWLEPAGVPGSRVHRMNAEAPDIDAAAAAYARDMAGVLGSPARLDLALLGVGPDGHVCSLFPGHPLLEEGALQVAAVHDSPKPPPRRVTLTLAALATSRLVVVVATGAAKAAVVREAATDPASRLPLALALRGAPRALLLLDPASAEGLPPGTAVLSNS